MIAKRMLLIDSDLAGVDKTLKHAAKSALVLARHTKTPCYVMKEGKIVDIAKRQIKVVTEKRVPTT